MNRHQPDGVLSGRRRRLVTNFGLLLFVNEAQKTEQPLALIRIKAPRHVHEPAHVRTARRTALTGEQQRFIVCLGERRLHAL